MGLNTVYRNSANIMYHLCVVSLILSVLVMQVSTQNTGTRTFSAVTRFDELIDLYKTLRTKESYPRPPVLWVNPDLKKEICRRITTSGYFNVMEEDPVDIDDVADELTLGLEKQKKYGFWNVFFARLLEDYAMTSWHHRRIYTYPPRIIFFSLDHRERLSEYAFPCLTRNRRHKNLRLYYVSDPYNVNKALEVPVDVRNKVEARFLCLTLHNFCRLVAIAEDSAVTVATYEYSNEDLYLQMRKSNKMVERVANDPLCGLTASKKLRVCASVLNSNYFVTKVKYLPDYRKFESKCDKVEVTFLTSKAKAEAKDDKYEEWMLPCSVEPIPKDAPTMYYVSRAYTSHYAFVYVRQQATGHWYIENISKNISVIIDKGSAVTGEKGGSSPPNLGDLLLTYSRRSLGQRTLGKRIKVEYNEEDADSNKRFKEGETSVKKEELFD